MRPSKAWVIGDTIEKNKRIFKIPVYQRNYDWTDVQCEKLYADIIEAFETDKKHFTGAIVYITGNRNSSSLSEDLIIDGQQRITSILLLLKALLDIAKEQNKEGLVDELQDLLFNKHCDEEYKLKLKPVKADDKQFQLLMQDQSDSYDTDSHIIRNYKLFKKLIYKSLDNGLILKEILQGMKKLEIAEIVLDKSEGDDPQAIFESINSTGLELSLADKIRNFVLMDDENQDVLFKKYWLPLEEKIGPENLADYFITYLIFKTTGFIKKNNAYDVFRKYFITENWTHESLLKDLTRYSKYYAAFIGRKTTYTAQVESLLNDLRLLKQTTPYPFMLNVFNDYEEKRIDEETLIKVLRFLRSYLIRRVVCESSGKGLNNLYKSLYSRIYKDPNDYSHYYEKLYSFFYNNNTNEKLILDDEFEYSLIHKNLYNKKDVCKFILAAIENEGSKEQILTSSLTIEHLLPQKENAIAWKKELKNDYEPAYKYLHTLGNLTITGFNSNLGTKSFAEKKAIIEENSKAVTLNKAILEAEVWNAEAILNRAKSLAKIVLDILSIDEAAVFDLKAKKSHEISYTLDDRDSTKNTRPLSYTFYGETTSVKNYNQMFCSVVKSLYSLSPDIFERLAVEKYRLTSSDRIYITTLPSEVRRPHEINNTGIFCELNLSSEYILLFIKSLIEIVDMDPDEFTFICESK